MTDYIYKLITAVQDEVFPDEHFMDLDLVIDKAIRLKQEGIMLMVRIEAIQEKKYLTIQKDYPKYKIKEFFTMQPKSTTTKNKIRFFQPYYNNTEGGLSSLQTMFSKLFNENEIYSQKILMGKLEQQKEKIFNYLIEAYTKSVYLNETEE